MVAVSGFWPEAGSAVMDDDDLQDIGWVMWAGTIGLESPISSRIEAARAARCQRFSVGAPDFLSADVPPAEIGRVAREAGLDLVVDPIMGWCGTERMAGPYGAFSRDEVLAIAAEIGAVAFTALGPFQPGIGLAEVAVSFGDLCDRAGEFGARVHLEFMPGTAIVDLRGALDVIEAADRDNGGVLLDTLHFFLGNPDMRVLAQVPGDRVFAVQVSDAPAAFDGDYTEATFHRLVPGDGAIDLPAVLGALDQARGLHWVGPEVISPSTAAMPPAEAATLTTNRIRDIIRSVRANPPPGR
jgi:sugar phosphate isomerase/epimerase